MTFSNRIINDGKLHVVDFDAHVDIFEALKQFHTKIGAKECIILNGLGSMEKIVLRFPKDRTLPPTIEEKVVEGAYEISSLAGNVKEEDGQIHVHLHGGFSLQGTEVCGGAVGPGSLVFKVAQLFIYVTK